MVVVQPDCCNQLARWTTTNSDYGDFYVAVPKEVKRQEPYIHNDCNKKTDALSSELSNVKAKLECLKQQCYSEPCPKTGFIIPPGTGVDPNKFSPKIGKCHCPSGPGPPNSNPYISICRNEFNGAKMHDPQFLEQHIKSTHPRLVKRVHPSKPYSAPCIVGNGDHFLGDDYNGSDCGSKSKGNSDRPRHCKMIGLYKRTNTQECPSRCGSQERSNNNNMRVRVIGNSGNNSNINSSRSNAVSIPVTNCQLEFDQRYNFYRYYEKNLSGFNLQDIFNNGDTINSTHNHYLEEIFPFELCISSCSNIRYQPSNGHSEQCPKFVNSEKYSSVSNSEQYFKDPSNEYPKVSNNEQCLKDLNFENLETTNFDFCYYGKLFEGEILNFSTSKTSKYLDINNKVSKNLESNIQVPKNFNSINQGSKIVQSNNYNIIPYFKSSKLPPPCFHEPSTPTPTKSEEIPSKEFNTQETQTNKKVQKSKSILCEVDMFLEPKYVLLNNFVNGSSNNSYKNNSSANSYKSENENEEDEIEESINSPIEKPWEPRLYYEVDISPRQDDKGYGSFRVGLENEKNIRKNIFKCIEIESKRSQANFVTNREPRELRFQLDFQSEFQNDIDEIDSIEENTKHHQNQNNEDDIEQNSNNSLEFNAINKFKRSNNDMRYIKKNEYTGYDTRNINHSIENERNSSYNSFDSFNQSQNSPTHSSIDNKSIDFQIQNNFEQKIMPFSTITRDIGKNHLHNQLEQQLLSSQKIIFDPLDPLYLNLFVNCDGHHIGQMRMDLNSNKK